MNHQVIQHQLIQLLEGRQSHITLHDVLRDFPLDKINQRLNGVPYSPWELVDHIRIAQRDIIDYITKQDYKELKFPEDYWPAKNKNATREEWNRSKKQIEHDLQTLREIILNPQTDLTSSLSHNPDHNIFRELIVLGNHNSYHTGQILLLKRALKIY